MVNIKNKNLEFYKILPLEINIRGKVITEIFTNYGICFVQTVAKYIECTIIISCWFYRLIIPKIESRKQTRSLSYTLCPVGGLMHYIHRGLEP